MKDGGTMFPYYNDSINTETQHDNNNNNNNDDDNNDNNDNK